MRRNVARRNLSQSAEDRSLEDLRSAVWNRIGKPIEEATAVDRELLKSTLSREEMQAHVKVSSRDLKAKLADQHPFVRVLGKRPSLRTAKSSTVDQFGLFVETFGPPERTERKSGQLRV